MQVVTSPELRSGRFLKHMHGYTKSALLCSVELGGTQLGKQDLNIYTHSNIVRKEIHTYFGGKSSPESSLKEVEMYNKRIRKVAESTSSLREKSVYKGMRCSLQIKLQVRIIKLY